MSLSRQPHETQGPVSGRPRLARRFGTVNFDRAPKWRVAGPDVSGDELVLVVAIEDSVIVVTLF